MASAPRDENNVPVLMGTSSSDGETPVVLWADPTTHRLLTQSSGGGAPSDATYVTLSVNASLSDERVLTGTANQITITDNGAGSTVVLSLPQSIATSSTPTFASMTLSAASSLTLGTASTNTGAIILKNSTNANNTTIQAGAAGAALVFTLPTTDGDSGDFLQTDGNGVMSWAAAGGSGTVTDVSVVTANGVSGSVATSTTTPAITLTLGAITPTTVNGLTITSSTGTLTITNGKTLSVSNTLTFTGTDGSSVAFGTGGTVLYTTSAIPLTVGNTTIASGTTTRVLYDNAGVLGEYAISGSGDVAMTTSPTFVTPTLGAATATSINGLTITSSTGTLTITNGKTLSVSNTLTLAGTDSTTMTFPTTSASIARTDAGQTFTGTQLLAEGASIGLDPAGSADGAYSGITVTATAGYTQAFGDLVYLDPTDSRWEATDANAASGADGDARGILGMVVVAGTDGAACTVLLNGIIRADVKFPTFTVNNPIYVSETAGEVTQTQPTTTDVVIRIVGAALTADSMYFNPDQTWITHV